MRNDYNISMKGKAFLSLQARVLLALMLFPIFGCKDPGADFSKAEPLQMVRVKQIEKKMNSEPVQFSGQVKRVQGKRHRILLEKNPCSKGSPRFQVIVPTIDRQSVGAKLVKNNTVYFLEFIYPPLFLDELQVNIEMSGCGDSYWLLPISSIVNPTGDHTTVFVVREGRALRVETGEPERFTEGRVVLASSELKPGDQVIVEGLEGLVNGEHIEVIP